MDRDHSENFCIQGHHLRSIDFTRGVHFRDSIPPSRTAFCTSTLAECVYDVMTSERWKLDVHRMEVRGKTTKRHRVWLSRTETAF